MTYSRFDHAYLHCLSAMISNGFGRYKSDKNANIVLLMWQECWPRYFCFNYGWRGWASDNKWAMLCLNEWWLYELLFEFMGGCVTKVGEWVGRQAESSRGSWEWWILKTNSGLSWTINLPFGIDFGINLDWWDWRTYPQTKVKSSDETSLQGKSPTSACITDEDSWVIQYHQ